jgi:hypothetical protein
MCHMEAGQDAENDGSPTDNNDIDGADSERAIGRAIRSAVMGVLASPDSFGEQVEKGRTWATTAAMSKTVSRSNGAMVEELPRLRMISSNRFLSRSRCTRTTCRGRGCRRGWWPNSQPSSGNCIRQGTL